MRQTNKKNGCGPVRPDSPCFVTHASKQNKVEWFSHFTAACPKYADGRISKKLTFSEDSCGVSALLALRPRLNGMNFEIFLSFLTDQTRGHFSHGSSIKIHLRGKIPSPSYRGKVGQNMSVWE